MRNDGVVHVIDDDADVRRSVAFLLGAARIEVAAYESATAFLDALPGLASGCVVTDVRMPGMSGIELVRRLRDEAAAWPVIVVTGHGDVPMAVEAMKAGASDFIEKPFEDETLLNSVRRALGQWEKDARQETERREYRRRIDTLTGRERDAFDGLVAGKPNKIIAHDLGISPRTVEIYRAKVMTKMDAASLSDLVRMAMIAEASRV